MAQPDYGQGALNAAGEQGQNAINAGVTGVQGANTQGQGAINQFNPQDVTGAQLGTGPQNATDYTKQYAQTVAANPQMQQAYKTAGDIYNVPQLTQNAAYLQGQVAAQPSQQYALSRGFDVSDPQVQNQINVAERFLQPQAQLATQQAQAAQGLQQGYVGQQQAQNQMNLLPVQAYGNYLSQAQNNEYQALTAKMNAGVTLSTAEMAQLSALEQAAATNATSLGQAGATYAGGITQAQINNQYQKIGKGDTLVNTGLIPGTTATAYNPFVQGLVNKPTTL